MTSSGDVGGEVSGEEAAWRDLIARFNVPADTSCEVAPWPSREDLPDPEAAGAPPSSVVSLDQPGEYAAGTALPSDRSRVIRHLGDPRSYSPPEEEDERYVPVPLPPPDKLDPVAKFAWAALVGGPGYLLIATFLHWTISGIAACAAVGAFIGGFVTLVIRFGDRQHRDGNDDGAVL
jgi:hypothetical protein